MQFNAFMVCGLALFVHLLFLNKTVSYSIHKDIDIGLYFVDMLSKITIKFNPKL